MQLPWSLFNLVDNSKLHPLAPIPATTSCDECWPLFHFWCHHLWPKLASFILKYCKRKGSFQWYPDESDQLSGAWNIHKIIAQKFEWKTWSKISCGNTWLLRGKICPYPGCFLRIFWTGSSQVEGQSLQQKDKKRWKRKGAKRLKKQKG